MTTSNITVSPLTPAIGAEIGNVDLGQVTDQEIIDIRAALLKHKVVFFREQTVSQAQHIGLARGFGELEIHPATPSSQSNPEVLHIAHGPESKGQENFWHSDVTWREKPSLGSILKAVKVPTVGGDTLFANMVLAYELLPENMKEAITGRVAIHDIARVFAKRLNKSAEELRERYPPVEHPIVRTHPETGESVLYVNTAFTSHIKDMDRDESAQLLRTLYLTAANPEIQCRFRWEKGALAFWDNRASQHFASSDYFPQVRKMERVTIAGDRPFWRSP
jgi:taurine dioxygenase